MAAPPPAPRSGPGGVIPAEWPAQAADTIVDTIAKVRDKTTKPAIVAARAIVYGLIAAVLSSLAAGGSVHCTPGFNALRFFGWLGEIGPTWYTAVPTMHQAILARAARNAGAVAASRLRYIRSSSSSLPAQVMAEFEGVTGGKAVVATATLRRDTLLPLECTRQTDSWLDLPGEARREEREVHRYTFEWR